MKTQLVTCTVCPMGCEITVKGEADHIESVEGFSCKRGEQYARDEFICPKRTLTTTVLLTGSSEPLLPVRSSGPLPKDSIPSCMRIIRGLIVAAPVSEGQILLDNLAGTGVSLVACMEAKAV